MSRDGAIVASSSAGAVEALGIDGGLTAELCAGSLSILPTAFGPTAPGMNTLIAGPEAALVLLLYALVAGGLTGAIITLRDVR